jgi:hypothetical protein
MLPARPKMSGGNDRIAKNAASAASPVTRWRMHDPTVDVRSRHSTPRVDWIHVRSAGAGSTDSVAMYLR